MHIFGTFSSRRQNIDSHQRNFADDSSIDSPGPVGMHSLASCRRHCGREPRHREGVAGGSARSRRRDADAVLALHAAIRRDLCKEQIRLYLFSLYGEQGLSQLHNQ